jgi:hypothetical protein
MHGAYQSFVFIGKGKVFSTYLLQVNKTNQNLAFNAGSG